MIQMADKTSGKSSSSKALQHKIEHRQIRISQKIDEISHELDPAQLMKKGFDEIADAISENLGEKMNNWGAQATAAIKRDPLPITLAAGALIYWIVKSKKP